MSKETNELLIEENEQEISKKDKKQVKKAKPSLFFNKDSKIEISVNGYHDNETGELRFVLLDEKTNENENESNEEFDSLFTVVNYKFWFSRISYDKLNRYRTNSMIYNSEDQNNTINEIRLREFFLVYHLIDWNLTDDEGNKIVLTFDPNKTLSDKTLKLIYNLPSILMDTVLAAFERKMAIY